MIMSLFKAKLKDESIAKYKIPNVQNAKEMSRVFTSTSERGAVKRADRPKPISTNLRAKPLLLDINRFIIAIGIMYMRPVPNPTSIPNPTLIISMARCGLKLIVEHNIYPSPIKTDPIKLNLIRPILVSNLLAGIMVNPKNRTEIL